MKFKGEPNLFVRISNKYVKRVTGKKGFYFDENGEYGTDDKILIKLLSQNFEQIHEEENNEIKIYKCKKCNFETDDNIKLLAHYRKEHPKGDGK